MGEKLRKETYLFEVFTKLLLELIHDIGVWTDLITLYRIGYILYNNKMKTDSFNLKKVKENKIL